MIVKKLTPETTELSELTDVSCLFFRDINELKKFLNEQAEKEISNLNVQISTLEKKKSVLLENKEKSLKTIEEF